MLYFILSVISVLLYLVYRRLSELADFQKELQEDFSNTSENENEYSIKSWLKFLNQRLRNVEEHTELLSQHFTSDNPAGLKSDKYKRINNLIKIYAEHLSEDKKLNEKDALIRARFEVYEFGEDRIIREIDTGFSTRGVYWKERDKAKKAFYDSGILEKDIKNFYTMEESGVKKITPYYLMEPIYDVIVKQNYEQGQEIQYQDGMLSDVDDYYTYIKEKAIISKLEELGVIKKSDKESWNNKPKWIIPNTNIAELKKLIYEGKTSHDDDYFEEQFNEGKLTRLFY